MGKILTLLVIALLAIVSLTGFLFLNEKITMGSLKIAAGQLQLAQGEQMLANGKNRLAQGEQQLSQAQSVYNQAKKVPVWAAVVSPITGAAVEVGNKFAGKQIAVGKQQVASGREKIKSGEAQLAAGKLELSRGMERLKLAQVLRIVCASGTVFFTGLLIGLGFYWRHSLLK